MEIITILEKLANTTHHKANITKLINELPTPVRMAFEINSVEFLKEALSNKQNFPQAFRSIIIK